MKTKDRNKRRNQLFIRMLQSSVGSYSYILEEYINAINRLLIKEEKATIDWLNKKIEKFTEDDIFDQYGEEVIKLSKDFPEIHRNSTLITIYAAFEYELKHLCNAIESKVRCGVKIYNWRSNILNKVENYLKNNAKIKFPPNDENWAKVDRIRQMRNAIVHNSCYIDSDENNKELIDFIIKNALIDNDKLKYNNDYKLQLNDPFIFEVISLFNDLLKYIVESFSENIK